MSVLNFSANQHRLLTSAKAPRPGVRLLELDAGILDDIVRGRLAVGGKYMFSKIIHCTVVSY